MEGKNGIRESGRMAQLRRRRQRSREGNGRHIEGFPDRGRGVRAGAGAGEMTGYETDGQDEDESKGAELEEDLIN